MSDLLELVDQLTKPSIDHLSQTTDTGEWLRVHTVEHPPLLTRLEDAVRASLGSGKSGASTLARERNMLDSAALYEATRIRTLIEYWCRIRGVGVTRNMVTDLRRWYVAHIAQSDPQDAFYIRTMRGWVATIQGMLNKPERIEITTGCPVCGAREWWDRDGVHQLNPVIVDYHEGPDVLEDALAMCRACETVWRGVAQLRHLRILIDDATG